MTHPYTEFYPETHGHFAPTRFVQPAYSAACVPYRWMLREKVEGNAKDGEIGLAERLKIGWVPDREPDIRNHQGKEVETDWIQERENQLALLDTFFGALRPEDSLCFFYAKRTPLSEQSRRVIVGVGRVLSVGEATEYSYKVKRPPLRCVLWERNVGHSVRPGFADGFLFPYQEALGLAEREGIDPEEFVAFAPDEHFDAYSYGSELLSHDGAVASLVTCAATLHRIRGRIEGPWDHALAWIDTQLNRLWRARGAFPGLGSALSAFGYEWGFQHGSLLAYEIELLREREDGGDPWSLVDAVMDNPAKLGGPVAKLLTDGLRKGWKRLADDRRALLQLLGRCAVSEDQALRMYDTTARMEVGIEANDAELLRNPYLLFERDRRAADPIAFGAVDRGLFPDEAVREELPLPEPSLVEDPADPRRVRALVVDLLEEAAAEGHTLLPRSWVIRRARERSLQPPCPLVSSITARTCSTPARTASRRWSRAQQPAPASLPTKWTDSAHAARSSASKCSAERGASRTWPNSTGVAAWTPGSMIRCLQIRKSASKRTARGARRRPPLNSFFARGSPSWSARRGRARRRCCEFSAHFRASPREGCSSSHPRARPVCAWKSKPRGAVRGRRSRSF